MTGQDDRASIDRAYEVGATDFASKPLNWDLFRHRLRFLLRASRSLRELQRSQALPGRRAARARRLGHWCWNAQSNEMEWSEEIYRIFGLEPGDAEPNVRDWWGLVHPDDRVSVREKARGGRRGGERRSAWSIDSCSRTTSCGTSTSAPMSRRASGAVSVGWWARSRT